MSTLPIPALDTIAGATQSYNLLDHLANMNGESSTRWMDDHDATHDLCAGVICKHLGIERADMDGKRRTRPIPEARFLLSFCMAIPTRVRDDYAEYHWPLQFMSAKRNGYNHATILHGLKVIRNFIQIDNGRRNVYRAMFEDMALMGYRWPLVRMEELIDLYEMVRKSRVKFR